MAYLGFLKFFPLETEFAVLCTFPLFPHLTLLFRLEFPLLIRREGLSVSQACLRQVGSARGREFDKRGMKTYRISTSHVLIVLLQLVFVLTVLAVVSLLVQLFEILYVDGSFLRVYPCH